MRYAFSNFATEITESLLKCRAKNVGLGAPKYHRRLELQHIVHGAIG